MLFLLTQIILGAMFGTAALAKCLDRNATRRVVESLYSSVRVAGHAVWMLPALEFALAAALLVDSIFPIAAFTASGVLVLFSFILAREKLANREIECACFGALMHTRASWAAVARNSVLALLALLGGITQIATHAIRPYGLTKPVAVLLVISIIASAMAIMLALENRSLRLTQAASGVAVAKGIATGVPAPDFSLPATDGSLLSLANARKSRLPVLLVFLDPVCRPCRRLAPLVAQWQSRLADRITVVVLSRGSQEANLALAREFGLRPIAIQRDFEVAAAFGFRGTPSGILIDANGRVMHSPAQGGDAIIELFRSASDRHTTDASEMLASAAGANAR
jgi:peroxiredoxin